jgi:hypothetical protein
MSSTAIPILLAGVFLFTLYLVVRTLRRQAEIGRQVRQRLGFISVEPVDPALVERIAAILVTSGGKVSVSKVYKRDQGSYWLYDCRVMNGRNAESADQSSVIVGRDWQLPSLRLAPRLGGEGKGWNLLNRLTLMASKQGGFEQVELSDQPEFSKKYVALSRTPQDVPRLIPGEVWRDLAAFPEMLFIQAEGDTVIFSTFQDPKRRAQGDFETIETAGLNWVMETGRRLNNIFESCHSRAEREPSSR